MRLSQTGSFHVRRFALATPIAVLASLVMATSALAAPPSWTTPQTVRSTNDPRLSDADFQRRNVAIAWDEPDTPREVGIRTSTNAGSSFGPISWFDGARNAAVDVCGSEVHAAMEMAAPGTWLIQYAAGGIAGGGFSTVTIAPSIDDQSDPDVACTRGRVFVSWLEEDGPGHSMYVAHALRSGGPFSAPIFLGFDDEAYFGSALAVAGVRNMAYAVHQEWDGDLYLTRWSIGAGPGFAVTPLGTQSIGPGVPGNEASDAVIAASGSKVAVAWFKCGGLFARVSNDHGATWGPARKLIDHVACEGDFGTSPASIALRGNKIALTYLGFGIPNVSFVGLIRTSSDFAAFSDVTIAENHNDHRVGYVRAGGTWRLAAAFETRGDRIRFRRQT